MTTHALPLLENEARTKDTQQLGQFLLTVCMSMAAAVLSAAFVVFLVKERHTKAKHVQVGARRGQNSGGNARRCRSSRRQYDDLAARQTGFHVSPLPPTPPLEPKR